MPLEVLLKERGGMSSIYGNTNRVSGIKKKLQWRVIMKNLSVMFVLAVTLVVFASQSAFCQGVYYPDKLCGDVDGNGMVEEADAIMIGEYVVHLPVDLSLATSAPFPRGTVAHVVHFCHLSDGLSLHLPVANGLFL